MLRNEQANKAKQQQRLIPYGMDNVTVRILDTPTTQDWTVCKDLTLATVGKSAVKPVDHAFKEMALKSEHSPIRALQVSWVWENLPSWVSVHLTRHHVGCTPFVQSQRNDRQDAYDRNTAPQNIPVIHAEVANFQSIIDISKMRLCFNAAAETRYAWLLFLKELEKYEPELVAFCKPKCVYRGGICGEPRPCNIRPYVGKTAQAYYAMFGGTTHV